MSIEIATVDGPDDIDKIKKFIATQSGKPFECFQRLYNYNRIDEQIPYGVMAIADGAVVGSWALLHQGMITHRGKRRLIVNLSTWYVEPQHPGLIPLIMLKRVMEICRNCDITSYTPNDGVEKMLSRFGFKKMPIRRFFFHLFDVAPSVLSRSSVTVRRIAFRPEHYADIFDDIVDPCRSISVHEVTSPGIRAILIAKRIQHRRASGLIRLPSLAVMHCTDYGVLKDAMDVIALRLMVSERVPMVSLYVPAEYETERGREMPSRYLIHSPVGIEKIPPVNSELWVL